MKFEDMRAGYQNLWNRMTVTRPDDALAAAKGIIEDKARYDNLTQKTGVPWFFVGPVHQRESNRNFAGVLHNGERIIGTGRKTSLVPAGRGPFNSWEEAAIDALKLQELDKIQDWTLPRVLYEFEKYNGFGYVRQKVNSPYVWAGTNLQQSGKYVADGVFDRSAWDKQLGCAAILSKLIELDESIAASLGIETQGEHTDGGEEPGPFATLKDFSTSQLIEELLTRPHVADVNVNYRKTENAE